MNRGFGAGILAVICFFGVCSADCPPGDLTGDCFVNLEDVAILADWWMQDCDASNEYCDGADLASPGGIDISDLDALLDDWLENYAFITTWDTSLGEGTTVTLALAGAVDADIDWGDGSPLEHVMTPGPHVHDYGQSSRAFAPGMVFTCEPGIYIREEGIGIRLENDILITDQGPVDLMGDVPIEADQIEALMAREKTSG